MKNFEMHCPVEGSSALQPKLAQDGAERKGFIIAFPGAYGSYASPRVQSLSQMPGRSVPVRFDGDQLIKVLRNGSVSGLPYNRMQRWQAVVAGIVFSVASFGSMLLFL